MGANSPRLRSLLRQATGIVPGNFWELVPGSGKVEKQGTAANLRAVKHQDAEDAAGSYAVMMRKQGDLHVLLTAEHLDGDNRALIASGWRLGEVGWRPNMVGPAVSRRAPACCSALRTSTWDR
jgi:hypothetical protein